MSEHMTSPGDSQPPKDWWLENACRIAAFRLRQAKYLSSNTVPLREQVRDSVDFVMNTCNQFSLSTLMDKPRVHAPFSVLTIIEEEPTQTVSNPVSVSALAI